VLTQQRNDKNVKASISELKLNKTIRIMRCISFSPLPKMIAISNVPPQKNLIITTVMISLLIINEEALMKEGLD
jgi:hypothetical protein